MLNLSDIVQRAWYRQHFHTPYASGNLARSIGDFGGIGNERHYLIFNKNQSAPYGAILNEKPVIHYVTIMRGKTYTGHYINRHYGWVDNFIEAEAAEIDTELGTYRG